MVARLAQCEQRKCCCRLARTNCKRPWQTNRGHAAAFKRIDPRFERPLGGVHDAGVDVADLREREQVGCPRGVAQVVGRRLIDRDSPCTSSRVGISTDMNLLGLKTPLVAHRAENLSRNSRPHKSTFEGR